MEQKENLKLYEAVRSAPEEALKQIQGGRLKGMSDINPMWRIKTLTEQFGPCGIGWKYTVENSRLEPATNGEVSAFVDIKLYFKHDGEWSEAIPGTGGSAFVANEKNGLRASDECFKMALTDALSVACKALGVAADVYWEKDATKYSRDSDVECITQTQMDELKALGVNLADMADYYKCAIENIPKSDAEKTLENLRK